MIFIYTALLGVIVLVLFGLLCTLRAEIAYRRGHDYVTDINPPLDKENP